MRPKSGANLKVRVPLVNPNLRVRFVLTEDGRATTRTTRRRSHSSSYSSIRSIPMLFAAMPGWFRVWWMRTSRTGRPSNGSQSGLPRRGCECRDQRNGTSCRPRSRRRCNCKCSVADPPFGRRCSCTVRQAAVLAARPTGIPTRSGNSRLYAQRLWAITAESSTSRDGRATRTTDSPAATATTAAPSKQTSG